MFVDFATVHLSETPFSCIYSADDSNYTPKGFYRQSSVESLSSAESSIVDESATERERAKVSTSHLSRHHESSVIIFQPPSSSSSDASEEDESAE